MILGSLPGDASLAARQYYAHPQNAFWRLLGDVIGLPLTILPYEERAATIQRARIALWDVIASARRPGSLDTAIRDSQTSDLASLVASLPELRAVAFNGKLAAQLGTPLLAGSGIVLVALPSSSAAHTLAYGAKRDAWSALQFFLID